MRISEGYVAAAFDFLSRCKRRLAEREGFEPPVPFGTMVFKTTAFDHSATSPNKLASIPECYRELLYLEVSKYIEHLGLN